MTRIDFAKREAGIKKNKYYPLVINLLTEIESVGFEAACLGGYVRDQLRGEPHKDIDIFVKINNDGDEKVVDDIHKKITQYSDPLRIVQIITLQTNNSLRNWFQENIDYSCCLTWLTKNEVIHYGCSDTRFDIEDKILNLTPSFLQKDLGPGSVRHTLSLINRGWVPSRDVLSKLLAYLLPLIHNKAKGTIEPKEYIEEIIHGVLSELEQKPGGQRVQFQEYEGDEEEEEEELEEAYETLLTQGIGRGWASMPPQQAVSDWRQPSIS